MGLLTRDMILQVDDLRREPVEVPEWNGTVYVRILTGNELAVIQQIIRNESKSQEESVQEYFEHLVIFALCDEQGESLFSLEDRKILFQKHPNALQRIFQAAQNINIAVLGSEETLEDAKKNSESIQSNGSGIDSPLPLDAPSES